MSDRKTQMQRIIAALKSARSRGCTSLELARIALRYGSRIYDLRKEGWKITKERMEAGYFTYRLAGHDL